MSAVKIGFVGYGNSAKYFHLPYILPNPDLVVCAFLQRKNAPPTGSTTEAGVHCTIDHPHAKHYTNAEDFFADRNIELVIVCTKPDSHAEFAEKALLAGKHVVVEKPFTVTSEEADRLISIARKQDKILTVYQNRRYDSDFRTLRHTIETTKALGQITEFENHYDWDDPPRWPLYDPPRPGDGMLYDVGVHSIDQTLLLFGLPSSVTAIIKTLGEGRKAEDTFTILLQYKGDKKNLLCTIKTTIISPAPANMQLKYYARGTHGTFTKWGQDPQIEHFIAGKKADDPSYGVESERSKAYLYSREGEGRETNFEGRIDSQPGSYMDYYRDVVAAIRGQGPLIVQPEESRNTIRVLELAKLSAERGVTLPWG